MGSAVQTGSEVILAEAVRELSRELEAARARLRYFELITGRHAPSDTEGARNAAEPGTEPAASQVTRQG